MRPLLSILLAVLATAPIAHAVTDEDRTLVYREFRTLFDARRYQEALPVAEKLIALTQQQYGDGTRALVNPLANLATTNFRLRNYPAAETSYLRSVEIMEATDGNTDRQLVRPLQGLGETYLALEQYEDAALALKRAVDLSRNLDGLFNAGQLEIIAPLVTTYAALGRNDEAEKEHQYSIRVAENVYGKSDPRILDPLQSYARWLESVSRFTTARAMYARALSIAESNGGRGTLVGVDPLVGIARTYRLEFLYGGEEEPVASDPFASGLAMDSTNAQRLNPDGERALRMALMAIERTNPVPHDRKGATLIELGDWYLSGGATAKSLETYGEAWIELNVAGSTEPLNAPRLVAYRGPPASVARSRLSAEDAEERFVEVRFTVTREGRTTDVETVGSDATESMQRSVQSAVKKARYGPKIENGTAVDATGVTLRERLLVKRSKDG